MYVLKYDAISYLKSIAQNGINITENLSDAIILKDEEEAKKLLDFCNIFDNEFYKNDYTIYEVEFKEVE